MGRLAHLRLRHFRNYRALDLEVTPGLTAFVGANGQGKTNLLEAIHYLSLLRSFRTRRIRDLRQWDASFLFVEGALASASSAFDCHKLTVTYATTRRLRLDGKVVAKASDFINQLICIAFVPEDIELVKGGPAVRRRFIDVLLCQRDRHYLTHLMRYTLALKSRNVMLREVGRYDARVLAAYDPVLAASGSYMIGARRDLGRELNVQLAQLAEELFGGKTEVRLRYRSCLGRQQGSEDDLAAQLVELFEQEQPRDREQGYTRLGPHRDELFILLNNRPAGVYGSEGQCRLLSLALRLASVEILAQAQPDRELILLVDDVLGELDSERRGCFLRTFARADQTFMACTEVPDRLGQAPTSLFGVEDGTLRS